MERNDLIYDDYKKQYIVREYKHTLANPAIKPERFNDITFATQFVWSLNVSQEYLDDLTREYGYNDPHNINPYNCLEQSVVNVAELLVWDKIFIYHMNKIDSIGHSAENRIIQGRDQTRYLFSPAVFSIIHDPDDLKYFSSLNDAQVFLDSLNIDPVKLQTITDELEIYSSGTASEALAAALMEVSVIV
ncbi:hypothetical protein JYT31_01820, partial [Beggiatoa alba]|nr:hypothetical protein [Beggiatoa alba]